MLIRNRISASLASGWVTFEVLSFQISFFFSSSTPSPLLGGLTPTFFYHTLVLWGSSTPTSLYHIARLCGYFTSHCFSPDSEMAKRSSKAWKQADGSNGGVQNPNKRHKPFYEELDATDAIDIRTANLDTVLNAFPKEWTKFQQIQLRLTIFNMPVTDVTMHLRDFYLLVCFPKP